jgi:hypothetical protein
MARYNEILTGRHNNFIKKLFAMKGEAPAPQLASEIMMVHPISHGVENRFLETWNRFSAAALVPANVGGVGQMRMTNDVGSNVVAVIEKLCISSAIAGEVDVQYQPQATLVAGHVPNLGVGVPGTVLDSRAGDTNMGSNVKVTDSNITNTVGSTVGRIQLQALVNVDLFVTDVHETTLAPQTLLQVQHTVANNAFLFWVIWRERFLEDSERA